uniref:Seipin n=1 Tax=Ditylenchus dipsaci TaxID=166011 RepID=A0A915CMS5_9BILA
MINSVSTGSGRVWNAVQQFSLDRAIIFVIQLILVVYLSFLTPLFVRYALAAKFVERVEPLEFTFQTCKNLESICSFPEAVVALEEENALSLQPGYQYSFTLEFTIFDTPQNRQLVASYNKGVPVLKSFTSRSFIAGLFVKARNVMFLPVYLCGFFADNAEPEVISVRFPNLYLEKYEGRTKFMVIQLQNKYIQISSASLKIRARVGLLCYIISEFPVLSYIFLLTTSFGIYFTVFVLHWAYKGINFFYLYSNGVSKSINVSNSTIKDSILNGSGKMNEDPSKTNKIMQAVGEMQLNLLASSPTLERKSAVEKEDFQLTKRTGYSKSEVPECPVLTNIHGWDVKPQK